jgi:PAS domain S-box-containing protein
VESGTLRLLHETLLGEAVMTGRSAVFVSDDVGRYIAVNDAAVTLLGYAREEFGALTTREVSGDEEDDLVEVTAMLKRNPSARQTATLRRKDGVVGTIESVVVESSVAGLPVIVSITAPIETFAPLV